MANTRNRHVVGGGLRTLARQEFLARQAQLVTDQRAVHKAACAAMARRTG